MSNDGEPDKKPFAGLRPGRMSAAGKVQPHERRTLLYLAPVAIALIVLLLMPKPSWWAAPITIVGTLALLVAMVVILARGLRRT